MKDILGKRSMVSQVILSSLREQIVEFGIHRIGIVGYRPFYVILLPVERGILIDALLLVKEGIRCFDTVFSYQFCRPIKD